MRRLAAKREVLPVLPLKVSRCHATKVQGTPACAPGEAWIGLQAEGEHGAGPLVHLSSVFVIIFKK